MDEGAIGREGLLVMYGTGVSGVGRCAVDSVGCSMGRGRAEGLRSQSSVGWSFESNRIDRWAVGALRSVVAAVCRVVIRKQPCRSIGLGLDPRSAAGRLRARRRGRPGISKLLTPSIPRRAPGGRRPRVHRHRARAPSALRCASLAHAQNDRGPPLVNYEKAALVLPVTAPGRATAARVVCAEQASHRPRTGRRWPAPGWPSPARRVRPLPRAARGRHRGHTRSPR